MSVELVRDRFTLAHHRVVARNLCCRDEVLAEARRVVDAWKKSSAHPGFVDRWDALLSLPVGELRHEMLRRTPEARALRSMSPFALAQTSFLDRGRADKLWRVAAGNADRILHPGEYGLYATHLKKLSREELRRRFWEAHDERWLDHYVEELDRRDAVIGHFDEHAALDGAIHVGLTERDGEMFAEIGVSVLSGARRRGVGTSLLARAALWARNHGAQRLYTVCLPGNRGMIMLARALDADIHRVDDEIEAMIPIPPAAPESVADELLENQIGEWDYGAKCLRDPAACPDLAEVIECMRNGKSRDRLEKIAVVGDTAALSAYLITLRNALTVSGAGPRAILHALGNVRESLSPRLSHRPRMRTFLNGLAAVH